MSKLFDAIGKAKRERSAQSLQEDADFLTQPLEPVQSVWPVQTVRPFPVLQPPPAPVSERMQPPKKQPKEGRFALPDDHLVSLTDPNSFEAEQYRALRHVIEQKHNDTGLSVVAVTSPVLGDGKTTTAINLAGALAQGKSSRVLLIDADLRRPSAAGQLRLAETQANEGFVAAISDPKLALSDVVRLHRHYNLAFCPAGRPQTAPYELLKSPRVAELIDEARRDYDFIVVDTPPVVSCPDCSLIEKHVDGFVMVVAAHRTPKKLVEDALGIVAPEKMLGLVWSGDSHRFRYYSAYGYSGRGRTGAKRKR